MNKANSRPLVLPTESELIELRRRKGARDTSSVPKRVLDLLHCGHLSTANLCEWLVVDQGKVAANVLPSLGLGDHVDAVHAALAAPIKKGKLTAKLATERVGAVLADVLRGARARQRGISKLKSHHSDIVRCWGCYLVGRDQQRALPENLRAIQVFAADEHFGVRECAWMAVRDAIGREPELAVELLCAWTAHENAYIRRFASEATRPRGVWCAHIQAYKEQPQLALPILEPLRSDPAKYVQDSVANWLNDAAKSRADWVREVTTRWTRDSDMPATAAIVKRALRSL